MLQGGPGELEDGSGPGPLPSRSRLLDLLSPARFPAAETAICAPAGETSTGLQPGGSQLLLSEGQSRSQRPADEDSRARKAIERLQDPKVTHLGCREDKRSASRTRTPEPARLLTNLGKLEDGSGPGSGPSGSRLLDLLSPARFPAAETAICALAGETSTGLQPGGSQLLLSEGQSRSQRPAFGLGNVAPRAAHAKSAWRPPYVVFPHCGRFQSCRGNPEAAGSQDCR